MISTRRLHEILSGNGHPDSNQIVTSKKYEEAKSSGLTLPATSLSAEELPSMGPA